MRTEGEWIYYTVQEAVDLLVDKLEDDEFNTNVETAPDDWSPFGSDAYSDAHSKYECELGYGALPLDKECIRRRTPAQPESMHFI